MNTTSVSLLARLRTRPDGESWRRLVDLYQPLLRRWLRGQGTREHDADDLVQEVLAVVFKELVKFKHPGHGGAFRGWLRTILVNRLRIFWRPGRSRAVADLDKLADSLADPDSDLSRRWDEEHDRAVLDRLLELMEQEFE